MAMACSTSTTWGSSDGARVSLVAVSQAVDDEPGPGGRSGQRTMAKATPITQATTPAHPTAGRIQRDRSFRGRACEDGGAGVDVEAALSDATTGVALGRGGEINCPHWEQKGAVDVNGATQKRQKRGRVLLVAMVHSSKIPDYP